MLPISSGTKRPLKLFGFARLPRLAAIRARHKLCPDSSSGAVLQQQQRQYISKSCPTLGFGRSFSARNFCSSFNAFGLHMPTYPPLADCCSNCCSVLRNSLPQGEKGFPRFRINSVLSAPPRRFPLPTYINTWKADKRGPPIMYVQARVQSESNGTGTTELSSCPIYFSGLSDKRRNSLN